MKLFKFRLQSKTKGSTLIEVLVAMAIMMMMTCIIGALFMNLNRLKYTYHQDLAYCIYDLRKDINEASRVEVSNDLIVLYKEDAIQYISFNDHRLVRTPGFIIYLHHIDNLSFSHDDKYVYMHLKRGEVDENIQIGLYYRAQIRGYECDCDDGLSDDSNDGFIDESIDSNQHEPLP